MALRLPSYAISGLLAITCLLDTELWAKESLKSAVDQVYPTAAVLPENLLRFYIYFSSPMREQGILDSIQLLDADGAEIEGVFLDNRYNLWSPDGQRLTLLLNPGRVKTGLAAHKALGRSLEPGQTYTLTVKHSALNRHGKPLQEDFIKRFRVTEMRHTPPELESWDVFPPSGTGRDPVSVRLDAVFDHHSLAHRVRVVDSEGNVVKGRIEIASEEREWRFQPSSDWSKGTYRVRVDPMLEDVAGNRLAELFDRPPGQSQNTKHYQYLSFAIKDDPTINTINN